MVMSTWASAAAGAMSMTGQAKAFAMAGGGFRAQSVDSGFVVGMLAFIGKHQGLPSSTMESTGLLSRFGTISTNSGSSWFFGSMAYSAGFKALLEQMAATPEHSAPLYRAGYTQKWLLATNVDEAHFNLLGAVARVAAKLLFGTGDEDSIYIITYFLATGFTWNRFTEVLLNSTAALTPSVPLGTAPAGSWADG